jgi:hypothetical protein
MSAATVLRALRRLPPLETLVLVLAFGLLVAVAIATQRAKTAVLPDSYSTYDAATGGYRALYELLGREGVRAGRFEQRPAFLTAQTDTLVWAEPLAFDPRQLATTNADVAALQEWVRAGGSLFYIGFDDVAAKRGILGLPRTRVAAAKRSLPIVATPLARAGVARIDVRAARRYRVERRGMRVLIVRGSRSRSRRRAAPRAASTSMKRCTGTTYPNVGGRSCRCPSQSRSASRARPC